MARYLVLVGVGLSIALHGSASASGDETNSKESTVAAPPAAASIAQQEAPPPNQPPIVPEPKRPQLVPKRPQLKPMRLRANQADAPPKLSDIDPLEALEPPKLEAGNPAEAPKLDGSDRPHRTFPSNPPPAERKTLILRLQHQDAQWIGKTLQQWSAARGDNQPPVSVAAVSESNILLVTGAADQLAAVRELVPELDRPAPGVHVRLAVVEWTPGDESAKISAHSPVLATGDISTAIAGLKEQGHVNVLALPELKVLDGQPARATLSARVPRIVGTSVSSRGQVNNVELENVGTTVEITARVADHQLVTLSVDLEHSHIGAQEEGVPIATSESGSVIRTPHIQVMAVKTTVSVPAGQTVVLAGNVQTVNGISRRTMVLIQPEITP